MIDEIRKLVSVNGVSGNEKNVCEYIKSQIIPYADKVYTDVLGNLSPLSAWRQKAYHANGAYR